VATEKTNELVSVEYLDGFSENSDIYADQDGKIYLWLPNGTYTFSAGYQMYTATVAGADTTAKEWFTGVTADGVDVARRTAKGKKWGYDYDSKTLHIIGDCVVSGTNTAGDVKILAVPETELSFTISNLCLRVNSSSKSPISVTNGTVTVRLAGSNTLDASETDSYAGLNVVPPATLIITNLEETAMLQDLARNMASNQQEYESGLRGLGVWGGSGSGGGGGRGGRGGGGNSGLSIEEKIANGWEKAFAKSNLKDTKLIEKEYEPSDAFKAVYAEAHQQNESSVGELAKAFKRLNEVEGVTEQEKRPSKQGDSGFKKFTEKMGELGGGLSQVSGGLKQIGIEVPESVDKVIGVIQGLTSILQGVQTVISIFSTSEMTANTIALAANTAALYAVAATNWIPFSGGGVVHAAGGVVAGNTYSNDMIPAALNAGEVVLNRAQVGNLASQIQGGGMSGMNLSATVTGEQIRLVLNNNGRRTGRGEYLQSNFR
jgi:hypothetical protein